MIPFNIIKLKYLDYFTAVALKTAINPISLLKISYDLTNGNQKLLKNNNFFAVKKKNAEVFNKYATPFDGINAGLDIIINHPEFVKTKVGTLKANESMQHQKLRALLKL